MNIIESKKFIEEKLLNNLENDMKISNLLDITFWKKITTIYLKFKENNQDGGFILTLMPYFKSTEIYNYLFIIPVDSNKNPKTQDFKFVECDENNINFIKEHIFSSIRI